MKKLFFILGGLVLAQMLAAVPPAPANIRLEVIGVQNTLKLQNPKAAPGISISRPKKNPAKTVIFIGKTPADGSWKQYEVSFTPDKFGEAMVSLTGSSGTKNKVRWTFYDSFEAEGTKINNPSFEKTSGGVYRQWNNSPWSMRNNIPDAKDGRNVLAATIGYPAAQRITLRKGVPVTIRFWAKSGDVTGRAAGFPHKVIFSRKPKDHYRFSNGTAKYLRLSDKGISGKEIKKWYPWIKPGKTPDVVIADIKGGKAKSAVIPFELLEENGIARTAQVRFGMPFPKGFLNATDCLNVTDPNGKSVPAQFKAISFWQDQSIKFVLVQFNAGLAANEKSIWKLHTADSPAEYKSPLKYKETADSFTVSTGRLSAKINKKKFALLQDVRVDGKKAGSFSANGIELIDEQGNVHTTSGLIPQRIRVEESGPLRLVIRVDGKYSGDIASYTARMVFHADSPVVEFALTHINSNLQNEFTDITSLKTVFIPATPVRTIAMDGSAAARIFQHHDKKLEVDGKISNKRISGAGTAGNLTFHLRDAAFRYPKAFSAEQGGLAFELLPKQPDPKFGTDLPWYLHFPYCEGFYRLKWGMGFTEDIKIDFSGKTAPAELAAKDIVPVIDRQWIYSTEVFPGVPSGNSNNFAHWDNKALLGFHTRMQVKEKQREYGFLNYGDDFGERGRNWNNNEYDTAHGLFMLFLRTGNRDTFRWARLAARHQADVDIIKAYPDPAFIGVNAQHGIGHTGISYQREKPASWSVSLDASFLGTNGHTWSEGMTEAWMLAGDIIPMNAIMLLGEHLVNYTAPLLPFLGTHERSAGWSSIALMGIYRATGDKKYLDAAGLLIDLILDEQKFDLGGAWPHVLPTDHAGGHKDSFGNCPYLVGIVTRALREYYMAVPSPEVKKSLIAAANWLSRGFDNRRIGWPYGMAYNNKYYHTPGSGLNMLISPGMMAGGRLENNQKIYEQANLIMNYSTIMGLSDNAKSLSLTLCTMPVLFDELNRFAAANKEVKEYKFNPDPVITMLCKGVNSEFRTRGPVKKEFAVKAAGAATLEIKRTRYGSRPKGEPEFKFSVTDAAGKEIFTSKDSVKVSKTWQVQLPGAGNYNIKIHDDWAGIWTAKGKRCTVYARIVRNYDFANMGASRQYLTIPAGTKKFSVDVTGVHQGICISFLLRPDGSIAATGNCETTGTPLLPWFKIKQERCATLKISLPAPLKKPETWKLVTLAGGDVRLSVKGIPGYISLVPVPFTK